MFLLLGIAVWCAFFVSIRAILKAGARADAAATRDEFAWRATAESVLRTDCA